MNRAETTDAVLQQYKKLYPKWKGVEVTEVVEDSFGGDLVVVRAMTEDGHPIEELCFSYSDGTVRAFTSTEELARFLEAKAKAPVLERLFSRPVFSAVVFSFLLVAVFFVGFFDEDRYRPEVLTMLGSVLGLAAGFFFGSSKGVK